MSTGSQGFEKESIFPGIPGGLVRSFGRDGRSTRGREGPASELGLDSEHSVTPLSQTCRIEKITRKRK